MDGRVKQSAEVPQASGQGAQRRILDALKQHGPLTASELAKLIGGGAVAIRVHLRNLRAAGLVVAAEELRPRGRPVRRFRLTDDASQHFANHYELFAVKLAEAIAQKEASLDKILAGWVDELADHLAQRLPVEPRARLKALAIHQSGLGFIASVEGNRIFERHCPIARVAVRFPQICQHEAALFRRTLGREVSLENCQARGDQLCSFVVGNAGP